MGIPADAMLGGASTARVPAVVDAADRARRAAALADAARYLVRRGHGDLLPMLGLDGADTTTRCAAAGCGRPLGSYTPGCRYCSRECSYQAQRGEQGPPPAAESRPGPRPVRDDVVRDLLAGRRAVTVTPAELDAAIDAMDAPGWSAQAVAERLGTTRRRVASRWAASRG